MVLFEAYSSKLRQAHQLLLIPFVSYMKKGVHLFGKSNTNNSFLMPSETSNKRRILSSGNSASESFGFLHWLFVFKYEINIKRIRLIYLKFMFISGYILEFTVALYFGILLLSYSYVFLIIKIWRKAYTITSSTTTDLETASSQKQKKVLFLEVFLSWWRSKQSPQTQIWTLPRATIRYSFYCEKIIESKNMALQSSTLSGVRSILEIKISIQNYCQLSQ